jgi:hypothetical protein
LICINRCPACTLLAKTPMWRVAAPAAPLFIRAPARGHPGQQRWQVGRTPVERAGLRLADLETGYLVKGPRVATYHYVGRAPA